MTKLYGPFYEGKNQTWHWHTECPEFPQHPNPKMMVSSSFPDKLELCEICLQLDKNDNGISAKK